MPRDKIKYIDVPFTKEVDKIVEIKGEENIVERVVHQENIIENKFEQILEITIFKEKIIENHIETVIHRNSNPGTPIQSRTGKMHEKRSYVENVIEVPIYRIVEEKSTIPI